MTALPDYDALLANGEIVHLRTFDAEHDGPALQALYDGMSARSIYLRWFTPGRASLAPDVRRMTSRADFRSAGPPRRAAVLAERAGVVAGVAGWELLEDTSTAEVAFVVGDKLHSLGLATLLLECLAYEASRAGIATFTADVLADNPHMVGVFRDAGYVVDSETHSGVVSLSFDIGSTAETAATAAHRESLAAARSLAGVLAPASIAVVGVDTQDCHGTAVAGRLLESGYVGGLVLVGAASTWRGRAVLSSLHESRVAAELVVIAGAGIDLTGVARDAAAQGALAVVALAGSGRSSDPAGLAHECRTHNLRLVGPGSLGVVNTSPRVRLDLLPGTALRRGSIGFVAQNPALAQEFLTLADQAGLGFTTVVTLGAKADVSGNDLLSWWEQDEATTVCALQLDSLGNPRKFRRIATRLGISKPIVALAATDPRVSAFLRQTGIVVADSLAELVTTLAVTLSAGAHRSETPQTGALTAAAVAHLQRLVAEAIRSHPQGGWLTDVEAFPFAAASSDLGEPLAFGVSLHATADGTFGPEITLAGRSGSAVRVTPLAPADARDQVTEALATETLSAEQRRLLTDQLLVLSELIEAAPEIAEISISWPRGRVRAAPAIRVAPRHQTMLRRQLRFLP